MDIFTVLADRLRERREAIGLTQGEAAEGAGVAQSYVSNLENGHNKPGVVPILASLASQYETSLDYLTGRTNQESPVNDKLLSGATHELLRVLEDLPEHRHEDLLVLADALAREERRRYAFWHVVYTEGEEVPLVGHTAIDGAIYYANPQAPDDKAISEELLIEVVIEAVRSLADDLGQSTEGSGGGLLESIRNLGRRLGIIKSRQPIQPEEVIAIVRQLLHQEDRSIPQAWLQAHYHIYISGGRVASVVLL